MNNARIYEIIPYVKRLIYVFFDESYKANQQNIQTVKEKGFFLCANVRMKKTFFRFLDFM